MINIIDVKHLLAKSLLDFTNQLYFKLQPCVKILSLTKLSKYLTKKWLSFDKINFYAIIFDTLKGDVNMSLKEYLLNLRNKLNQTKKQQVQEQEQAMEINYVYPSNDDELNTILTDTINNFFPTTGWWSSACFRRPNEILQSNLKAVNKPF